MGKKKKPSSNKDPELAVKVDSPEPKKKSGREPNDPLYDVSVSSDGDVDVVSEEAIENADYPPKFAEYLGVLFEGVREALGIPDDEEIPDEVMNEYVVKLLAGADIEKLVQELEAEKFFGVEEEKEGEKFESEEDESETEDEDVPTPDDFSDEELMHMAISELPVEEDGTRVWVSSELNAPEGTIGRIKLVVPIITDEEMIKNKVVFHISIPYFKVISFAEAEKDSSILEDQPCIGCADRNFYLITDETLKSYEELMELAGQSTETEKLSEGESFIDAVEKSIDKFAARLDGYYEDVMEYWYHGQIYHEKDVIWLEIPLTRNLMGNMKGFLANQDADGFFTPIDIGDVKGVEIKNGRKVLSNKEIFEIKYRNQNVEFFEQPTPAEEVWWLTKNYAKTKDSIGYAVVCLRGKFYIPVECFTNYTAFEVDYLATVFNCLNCMPTHHACAAMILGDIGNMQLQTFVRYKLGGIFDWEHRSMQELKMIRKYNANYDPYDDPYDNPDYGISYGGEDDS